MACVCEGGGLSGIVKDEERECRRKEGELVLVSTLFISHVRSENPEGPGGGGLTPHLSPLNPNQHLETRYFLIKMFL